MNTEYNKLVRDNIPEIIKKRGAAPITRTLKKEEYKMALEKKLLEEYQEVLESSGRKRLEKLADMLEVIKYLAKVEESSLADVMIMAEKKNGQKGSFKKRVFLESVREEEETEKLCR